MVLYLKTLYNMFPLSSICVINWNIIQVVTNICVFLSSSNPVCLEFLFGNAMNGVWSSKKIMDVLTLRSYS